MSSTARIAKNTLMLYFRQILIMLVSLYTVRVVLETLGAEDYGIYNVVGGIVMFFSFLSGTMASATQRFFSFALGQGDLEKLKKTFTVNLIVYGSIAVVAFILLKTAGLWFINERLHIPPDRFESAFWVFNFSVFTFIAVIFTTPFMAIIIAHEDMQIYAYISIIEAIMKLGVVFLLTYLPWDKLELYGMLIFAVSVIVFVLYFFTCTRKYKEVQFRRFYWDKGLLQEIAGFTGWTLFGQFSTVMRIQAVTILLNQMFNPVVVAAKAVAANITGAVNTFAANFNVGLYPPIIKSYAADDKKKMFLLIFRGSKITFFLMWVFALPLFLEMESVLQIWFKNPPPAAVLFTRLALIEVLINSISLPLATAARAPGKMKTYELTLGTIQIAIFPVSLIVLMLGGEASSVFIVAIAANLVMFIVRLLIVRRLIGFSLSPFFLQVIFPVLGVVLLSAISAFAIHWILPTCFIFLCVSVLLCVLISCGSMFFIGLDKLEREKVRSVIVNRMKRTAY